MLLINLFGAPSAGKSTGAAYVFSQLKLKGINAELVTEFAKDKVWEESVEVFNNQAYIFGEQYFRISRCQNKVDVIVTDSPLILSAFYNHNDLLGEKFNSLIVDVFNSFDSLNYFLLRDKPYNSIGRFQSETESDALVEPMECMLKKYGIRYKTKKGNISAYNSIVEEIINKTHLC